MGRKVRDGLIALCATTAIISSGRSCMYANSAFYRKDHYTTDIALTLGSISLAASTLVISHLRRKNRKSRDYHNNP